MVMLANINKLFWAQGQSATVILIMTLNINVPFSWEHWNSERWWFVQLLSFKFDDSFDYVSYYFYLWGRIVFLHPF